MKLKKIYTLLFAGLLYFSAISQNLQSSNFEDLQIPLDTFWNGSDLAGGFNSGMVRFENDYDTAWGGSWKEFSYSSMRDTITASYSNQYSCIAGHGVNNSTNYGVGYTRGNDLATLISLTTPSSGISLFRGVYLNNSTYAYYSMKNGDSFAKKFGDSTDANGVLDGTFGRDWLKLTVYGSNDSLEFYLADFRGPDSTDFIINKWTYLDLTPLNENLSLSFKLSSSDNGSFGMNTPGYFCLDSLIYDAVTSIKELSQRDISIFPNPTYGEVQIKMDRELNDFSYQLIDLTGRVIESTTIQSAWQFNVDLTNQNKGVYLMRISSENGVVTKRIIKQ